MFKLFLLTTLCSQTVEFSHVGKLAEVKGSPAELLSFYEEWRGRVRPDWQDTVHAKWWQREWVRVQEDVKDGELFFAYQPGERFAFWRTAFRRDCTMWFNVTVAPFDSFYVPYKPSVHILATVLLLALVMVVITNRKSIKQWLWQELKCVSPKSNSSTC